MRHEPELNAYRHFADPTATAEVESVELSGSDEPESSQESLTVTGSCRDCTEHMQQAKLIQSSLLPSQDFATSP